MRTPLCRISLFETLPVLPALRRIAAGLRGRAALIAVLFAAAGAVPAGAANFPAQSLIIPTQSSYQDACGMVSTYGLVYSVLRANDGWRANPVTTGKFTGPIIIHWVYSPTKQSPNRCVPTNLDKVYDGPNGALPGSGSRLSTERYARATIASAFALVIVFSSRNSGLLRRESRTCDSLQWSSMMWLR